MDISWPVAGSWALFACILATVFAWLLFRRDARVRELRVKLRQATSEERKARIDYGETIRTGTPEQAVQAAKALDAARKRVDELRQQIGNGLFALALIAAAESGMMAQGCRTVEPTERIVRLDSHVRIVEPGDVVPDYPDGESRWWLATPYGLESIVPQFREDYGDE